MKAVPGIEQNSVPEPSSVYKLRELIRIEEFILLRIDKDIKGLQEGRGLSRPTVKLIEDRIDRYSSMIHGGIKCNLPLETVEETVNAIRENVLLSIAHLKKLFQRGVQLEELAVLSSTSKSHPGTIL